MSRSNQGRGLQEEVARIAAQYERQGRVLLRKVDPPVRVVGTGFQRKTIFMTNPFLDFVGSWIERAGRLLAIEAKSTDKPTLGICQSGGLSEGQWTAMQTWAAAGGAVAILWEHAGEIRLVPIQLVIQQLAGGVKHVKWEQAKPVPTGMGYITWDWLRVK